MSEIVPVDQKVFLTKAGEYKAKVKTKYHWEIELVMTPYTSPQEESFPSGDTAKTVGEIQVLWEKFPGKIFEKESSYGTFYNVTLKKEFSEEDDRRVWVIFANVHPQNQDGKKVYELKVKEREWFRKPRDNSNDMGFFDGEETETEASSMEESAPTF